MPYTIDDFGIDMEVLARSENHRDDFLDVFASGDVTEACEHLRDGCLAPYLAKLSRERVTNALVETGGWERGELQDLDDEELHLKLIFSYAPDPRDLD